MTARSDRRAVLGGLAGCLAAGAIGAAAGTRTARAAAESAESAEATIDDRRIVEFAREFERLERQRLDLFPESGSAAVIIDDDERDAAIEPIDAAQERIADHLATLQASSIAAIGAVAAAFILWEGDQLADPGDPGECVNRRLSVWVAMQAAALAGRKA